MSSDHQFGPKLRAAFDFTLTFDYSILNILPCCLLILAAPLFISYYGHKQPVIHPGALLWTKLGFSTALFGVNIGSLVLWSVSGAIRSALSIASAVVTCVASLGLVACLYYDHRYTVRSSTLISIWLTASILFDGTTARSYYMRSEYHALGAVTVSAAALKLVMMVLQEMPKKNIIRDPKTARPVGKEAVSGFWNRTLYVWLNKTFYTGFRALLQPEDLDELGPEFLSELLAEKFNDKWSKSNKKTKHHLALTCLRILSLPILSIIVPRLFFSVCLFSQPYFLQAVIATLETQSPSNKKHFLVVAAALIYFGTAASRSLYQHMTYRLATLLRGVLVGAIIAKTLVLPHTAEERAAAVTLMSTDIELIVGGVPMLHETWIRILELGVGIYLLSIVAGRASFLVFFPTLVSTIVTYLLGDAFPTAKAAWNEVIQERVAKTSVVLSQIKAIKMAGLEDAVSDELQKLRQEEIKKSIKTRLLGALFNLAAVFCGSFTPPIVIAGALFWTTFSGKLTTSSAFTTLAIISLVIQPLWEIMVAAPTVLASLAGFGRIQEFLLLKEVQRENSTEDCDPGDASEDKIEDQRGIMETHAVGTASKKPTAKSCVARFSSASIAPQGRPDKVVLHKLDLSIEEDEFLIVSGPTGCGKSTFLESLLDETETVAGSATVEGCSKAYCGQTPWIKNTSIRNNIIGYEELDEEWYESTLDACLLREDLENLPSGDLTYAGSNGLSLSGGQKQRIATARALYSRKKIHVLDDIFSALDSTTSMEMFTRLLGPGGLLRRPGNTVILATNSLQFFETADRMLVIDKKGYSTVQTDIEDASFQEQLRELLSLDEEVAEQLRQGQSSTNMDGDAPQPTTEPEAGESPIPGDEGILAMRQKGDLGLYWFFAKSIGVIRATISMFLSMLLALGEKFPDVYIRIWLDRAPENNTYFAGYVMTSVFACFATAALFGFWYHQAVPASLESLHTMLLNAVIRAKLSYLTRTDHGIVLNFFSQDMTLVSQELPVYMQRLLYFIFYMVASLGIILSGVKYTAVILPFVLVALYAVQHYYLRTSRQVRHMDIESKAPLYAFLTETGSGLLHIRAFGWEKQCLKEGLTLLDASQKPFYSMFAIQRWLALAMDLIVLSMAMILLPVALNVPSSSTTNGVALSLITLIYFSDSLSGLIEYWTLVETGLGALARIRNLVQITPQESQHDGRVEPNWPQDGRVEMVNVFAKYDDQESHPQVLKGVSMDILAGDRIGIVGRTGSGKSSLLLALLNFLDYTGSITIDGIDISTVSPRLLRSRITTITQDSINLESTIFQNICPWAAKLSDEETKALESIIAEVLRELDMWTVINDGGGLHAAPVDVGLSKGQEQLLGIARGLVQQHSTGTKVVLMDEPTSNLDAHTETNVRRAFDTRLKDCTIITITHRAKSIADANTIYQIDNGKISSRTERTDAEGGAAEDHEIDAKGENGDEDTTSDPR